MSIIRGLHTDTKTSRAKQEQRGVGRADNGRGCPYANGMIFHCLQEKERRESRECDDNEHLRIDDTFHRRRVSVVGNHHASGCHGTVVVVRLHGTTLVERDGRQREVHVGTSWFHEAVIAALGTVGEASVRHTIAAAVQRTLVQRGAVVRSTVVIRVRGDWDCSFDPDLTRPFGVCRTAATWRGLNTLVVRC